MQKAEVPLPTHCLNACLWLAVAIRTMKCLDTLFSSLVNLCFCPII